MRLRDLSALVACAALSSGAFAQGLPDYDNFTTFPSTTYQGSYWDFTATQNEWYATKLTLASANPVKQVMWWLADTNAVGGASISPHVSFEFYNDNAGQPGTQIGGFSVNYGALTAGYIYSSTVTLSSQLSLAGINTNTIWVAIECTNSSAMGIGIGSTPATGTAYDVLGESATGAANSFSIYNNPFDGSGTGPTGAFAIGLSPEPCSMAILGVGAVGLIARRRRKA